VAPTVVLSNSSANVTTQINGANLGWPTEFKFHVNLADPTAHSRDVWIFGQFNTLARFFPRVHAEKGQGIINAASYFSAAIIGAQLSDPLNEYFFGRRGALFIAALFSFGTVIGAAYVKSWSVLQKRHGIK
jgi:hypothetical protein